MFPTQKANIPDNSSPSSPGPRMLSKGPFFSHLLSFSSLSIPLRSPSCSSAAAELAARPVPRPGGMLSVLGKGLGAPRNYGYSDRYLRSQSQKPFSFNSSLHRENPNGFRFQHLPATRTCQKRYVQRTRTPAFWSTSNDNTSHLLSRSRKHI